MDNTRGITRKVLNSTLYVLYLFVAVFILLEIILRIHNPFELRIKGDKIILPANQRTVVQNKINPRLDPVIVNTRNRIGLRGVNPPPVMGNTLSVITVGGSTTECYFLNDDSTWTARLGKLLEKRFGNVWINNAGLGGHSTFGHQLLLNDHIIPLKPKIVLFLAGINDVENDGPGFHDKLNTKGAYPDFFHYLYNQSEAVNLVVNVVRGFRARKLNNTTDKWKPPVGGNILVVDSPKAEKRLTKQKEYVAGYGKRISNLVDSCRRYEILPVFITQPWLYGQGIDSVTHIDLANYNTGDGMNGKLFWRILEMYNEKMRLVCAEKQVPVIDLACAMPKNSLYYYDATHYTNEGANMVAKLVYAELERICTVDYGAASDD